MKQLFEKIINNIELIITTVFLISLPVIYYTKQLDPVLYTRYLALSVWILVIAIVIIFKLYQDRFSLKLSRIDKLFFLMGLGFVIVNAISSFYAINSSEAIFKTFKEFVFVITLFVLHQMIRNNHLTKDTLIKSVILMTSFFIGVGVYQLINTDFSFFENRQTSGALRYVLSHNNSTLANINLFSYLLFLSLPFSLFGLLFYNKLWKLFSSVVIILSLGFVAILQTRGGWIATVLFAIISIVFIYIHAFFVSKQKSNTIKLLFIRVSLIVMPIIIVFVGGIVFNKSNYRVVDQIEGRFAEILSITKILNSSTPIDKPSSSQTRLLVWGKTLDMVKDNPYIGVGPGQWRIEYAKYGIDEFDVEIRNGNKHFQRPHNDMLWIMGETGVIGFGLYLAMYILVLVIAIRNVFNGKDRRTKVLNMFVVSALVGFLIALSVDFARERITHNIMYLLLMALVLTSSSGAVKIYNPLIKYKVLGFSGVVVLLLLLIFNIKLSSDMVSGERNARLIKIGMVNKNTALIQRAIRSIGNSFYTLDAFAAPIPLYESMALSTNNKIKEANIELKKAYNLHPYNIRVLNNLATSYNLLGDKEKALYFYQKALDISPRYQEVLLNTAIVNYNLNNIEQALVNISKVTFGSDRLKNVDKAIIAICQKRAMQLRASIDDNKLKKWIDNTSSIKSTFIRSVKEKRKFDKILLEDIGK